MRDLGQFEAVRRGQRQHDVVLGRRRLQFEVELAAEALAQRQAPGAIDPAAERRMDHQLHAAGFVEEAFEHDRVLRRQTFQRGQRRGEILQQLLRGRFGDADVVDQPVPRIGPAPQQRRDARAQTRHRRGQFVAAAGRLAEPERDRRRRAVRVLHPHHAALDPHDAIGAVAELEHVAGQALDGEVLVDAADHMVLGFQQHLVIGGVRDRAAGGQRGQPCAAPAAHHVVDRVVMDQCAATAAAGGEAIRQHVQHGVEIVARQVAIRPGAAQAS